MKTKIFIFSSLLCLYGASVSHASDCVGADCDIAPIVFEEIQEVTYDTEPVWDMDVAPMPVAQPIVVPAHNVKIYSVKPTVPDNRPALWDGTHGKYNAKLSDKTVDWQNGVPIWDDSIASYKYKDFSDWFLEPTPEVLTVAVPLVTEALTSTAVLITSLMSSAVKVKLPVTSAG